VIASALIGFAAIGWTGTWSRRFYAAQDFLEPWQEVASRSAALVRDSAAIVTNSPVFLFYLSPQLASNGAHDSQVYFVERWWLANRPKPLHESGTNAWRKIRTTMKL